MSIQWTLVAAFLYTEVGVVLLLVLPVASPKRWQKIFRSRFLQAIASQAQWYFAIILFILLLFLLDAIREIRKYSNPEHNEVHLHLDTEMQSSMRLFRAQRNFYISGFALFLSLVVRRLVILISTQATLMAENEASLKQAKSATTAARNLLAGSGDVAQNAQNEAHQKELNKLNEELSTLKCDLEKAIMDKEAVISQAKSIETEYDRLTEEHRKLQLKLKVTGDESDKKDE